MKQKLIFLAALLTALSAFSAEYFVDASRPNDNGAATNWATAKKTIQAAVGLTVDGDTVWVTNGIYDTGGAVTPGYSLTNRVCITNAITVQSVNGAEATIIKGAAGSNGGQYADSVRGALMRNGCTLSGFTITGGYTKPTGNSRDCAGGGVWLESGCVVSNCILSDNTAAYLGGGGAILYYGGTLDNCVLTGNKLTFSSSDGGGANLYRGGILNNCTLSGNSASDDGGGVYLQDGGTLNNCIVWGNTSASVGNDIYQTGNGNVVRYTCALDGVTNGMNDCITNNPLFEDVGNSNFQLQEGSLCINAGNNTEAPTGDDLSGHSRIVDGAVDMGAYENPMLPKHTITTAAETGGFITPAIAEVFQGYDKTFVIWPDVGFCIDSLIIDGVPSPATSIYTFTNVQSGHTISAKFVAYFDVYYVDASRLDDTGSATSWATAKKTIQAAVDLTSDGDVVWVTNGLYDVGGAVTPGYLLTNRVCITKDITVKSVNGPGTTFIKGAAGSNGGKDVDSVRGVLISRGASLIGFTVTNGYTMESSTITLDYVGGGILIMTNSVASNCVITGSTSSYGGGACLYQGGELSNCRLDENASNTGGGVFCFQGGMLNGCELVENWAQFQGGGVSSWFSGPKGVLRNCILRGNQAPGNFGGGMHNGTAYDCIFSSNYSPNGGGMYEGTAHNCVFTGNSAGRGGGTFNSAVYNSVVYSNSASTGGGMAYGAGYNSIIWGNDGGNFFSGSIAYSCCPEVTHGSNGNITNAPLFMDAANGDFRLLSNSPCINWGNNSYVTNSTDLDGNPRIVEGVVDMGAYEYQGIVGLADSDNDGINDDWERAHGGNQNPNNTCSNGVNTILQAYVAGLDPNDPNSKFLTSVLPGSILQWQPCTSGRVYSVQWSTNLLNGFQPLETNISWTAGCFTDAVHNAYGQLFYKIDVRLEE